LSTTEQVVAKPHLTCRDEQALQPPSPPAATTEGWPAVARRLLILIALYGVPAVVLLRPVTDPDIWWHLRVGQWVVEHRNVPATDPFSAYGHDRPWVAYSWLFEVLVYELYRAAGLTGILVYRVLLSLAVIVAIHRLVARREPRFVRATVLTVLAYVGMIGLLNERPWLFTMLFVILTLEVVLRLRDGSATRAVWLLPAVFAVWANIHIQFLNGLAILGLACVAPIADALLGRSTSGTAADTVGTRPWWRLVGLTAACAAATLVNPYGARLYVVVWEYASQPVAFDVINELRSPDFRMPYEWAFLALAGAAAFALGRRTRPSVFDLLLLAGAALAAFRARRDIWFLVVVSLAMLTSGPRPAEANPFLLSRGRALVVGVGLALFVVLVGVYRNLSEPRLEEAVAREYPVAAVEHVRASGYPGPLFNELNWGGFLIWALPEHAVSMDGRTNLHGDERLARHVNTIRGLRWQDDDDLKAARLVIADRDGPLAALLNLHPHFQRVYADRGEKTEREDRHFAAVFIARDGEASASPP
jgi:hypothetical protein